MLPYDDLSQTAREVVRLLFLSDHHTAPADQLAGQTYYPDAEVLATLTQLERNGLVSRNETGHYVLAAPMVTQLLPRQQRADARLQQGIELARQLMATMHEENLSPDEVEMRFRAQMQRFKRDEDADDE